MNATAAQKAEARRQMRFGHRDSNAIAEALPERTGCHLDARRDAALGMTRCDAVPLPELFDLFERNVVTGRVKK